MGFKDRLSGVGVFLLRRSVFAPALLMLAVVALLVNPTGDFPLNDDWAYAEQVHELLANHHYQSSLMAMAFAQSLWGALVAGLFGENYTVLRFSTLALALVTMWATSRCAQEIGLPRWVAVVCAAVLLCNPIFLNLSYTFMTEVPFMAPFTIAGFYYLRALKSGKHVDLLLGGLFGVIAASSRQFGIILAVAVAVTGLFLRITRRRSFDLRSVALFVAPWAAAVALYFLLPALSQRPPAIGDPARLTAKLLLRRTMYDAGVALIYAGLFVLPVTLGRLVHLAVRPRSWTVAQWVALPLSIGLVFYCATIWGPNGAHFPRLPMLGNILHYGGTGPLTLRDTYLMGMPRPILPEIRWWVLLTGLSLVSVGVFLAEVVVPLAGKLFASRGGDNRGEVAAAADDHFVGDLFLLVWSLGILLAPYHLVMAGTFDRYLLPAAAPLVVLCARGLRQTTFRALPVVIGALCLIVALPGLAAVQDYLAWNRARWQALDYLRVQLKVPPQLIDGGYEFNSVFTRDEATKLWGDRYGMWGPNGFWVLDDVFAVSFNWRPGYRTIATAPYFSWLGMKERSLMVLDRRPK